MSGAIFLPGVDEARVREAFARSPGNELLPDARGVVKFESPESSAALAANVFGWFLGRADRLPPVDGLAAHWPVREVLLEAEMRFPWSGGKHPWLDAALVTGTALVGVESKRYEPFRPKKPGGFSQAYDRPVWGERMAGYCRVRDEINGGRCGYRVLDAAQLVKHAFGLRTRTHMGGGRFQGLTPVLLYLYAEPPA